MIGSFRPIVVISHGRPRQFGEATIEIIVWLVVLVFLFRFLFGAVRLDRLTLVVFPEIPHGFHFVVELVDALMSLRW